MQKRPIQTNLEPRSGIRSREEKQIAQRRRENGKRSHRRETSKDKVVSM